jgi:hypothetical protein
MHGRRRSVKTTVDQPLMRGLVTALPNIRPGLSLSLVRASILWDRPRGGIGNTPTVAPPPALHGRDGWLLSSAWSVAGPLLSLHPMESVIFWAGGPVKAASAAARRAGLEGLARPGQTRQRVRGAKARLSS